MIAIVKSEFNSKITNGLMDGCLIALREDGLDTKELFIKEVPGAFEIPAMVKRIIKENQPNIILTLGCVIKGQTDHYHYICDAVTNGMMKLTLQTDIPILFGILTCQNSQLASDRSGKILRKNKGYELGKAVKSFIDLK